ncbi:RraA family protein [Pseudonocardia kunmingensis]|uniref:Putative 4-hydroxy-4-methyl-2-oxoglutarate aldolase n=1 Tax=Pseudonocardia kunmingensis TaxID=630975 RepID=A0A543DZD4_9PSEU|nr:RraA family protein [Pseudonocardia kunmingensis]TQM14672.1 regulator of RNase E activity RraA [Pseudonocardia kunmingensis]
MEIAELVTRLARLQVSSLSDADKTLPVCDPAIGPLLPDVTLVGTAFTVRSDGDLLGMIDAIGQAGPGTVLVAATDGSPLAASGELFATEGRRRGIAGIAVDGWCRDLRGLRRVGLPVFARGTTPAAGPAAGPSVVQVPVRFGGVDVRPGDIVFGDDDGLLIAPPERVAAALERAEEIERVEAEVAAGMGRGRSLHELTNAAEHLRAVAAGEPSTFRFQP